MGFVCVGGGATGNDYGVHCNLALRGFGAWGGNAPGAVLGTALRAEQFLRRPPTHSSPRVQQTAATGSRSLLHPPPPLLVLRESAPWFLASTSMYSTQNKGGGWNPRG